MCVIVGTAFFNCQLLMVDCRLSTDFCVGVWGGERPFNGVLENTTPMTLPQTFPNTPDATTGLLHLGNGRWYDPAWGRPLQPNAAGGPPTVPLGQPGVYAVAASSQ
jgi:hypothetical protein